MRIRSGRQRATKGDSRTIPRPGATGIGFGQDDDDWFSCWNCGFICNSDRESSSGSTALTVISTESYQDFTRPISGDPLSAVLVSGGETASTVLMELSADGVTARDIMNQVVPKIDKGCPLCGTLNWRGDN